MQPNINLDFITRNTALYINDYLRKRTVLNPKGLLNVYLKPLNLKSEGTIESYIIHDFIKLITESISSQFGFSKDVIELDRINYQVLQKGDSLGWHTDAYGGVDGYDETCYSALLYLTDEYEGGEIIFYNDDSGDINSGESYKPKAGTLVYFKGDKNYPHSVNEIKSGERSNLILFFTLKK